VIIGRQPVTYQWLENGVPISGATNAAYTFTPILAQSGHTFQVLATNNISGTNYNVASTLATLTVRVPLNLTWAGTGGNWDIASLNWTTNANVSQAPFTEGDNATFDNLGAAQSTVNLTQTLHPSSVTASGTASYTLNGGGSIAGFASLTKSGAGTLTIDTLNSYTGSTTVSGGTLQIGDGTTTGRIGSGPVTNNAAIVVSPGAAGTVTLTNTIHGSGSLTMNGNAGGSLVLSASNSYAGGTTISVGTLHARNAAALGTGSTVVSASGAQLFVDANVDLNPQPLTLNGSGIAADGALHKGGAGVSSLGGTVTLGSDTTLNVDGGSTLNLTNASGINGAGANANLTLTGPGVGNVPGPVSLGTGGVTVNGGTWSLSNPVNNYSGVTVVNLGTLMVNTAAGLGTAPGSFNPGQITLGNGSSTTVGTLGASASFALNDGLRGITVSTSGGITVNSNVVLTIANEIGGFGILTKNGAGTLVLSGNNSFGGQLNIDSNSITANDGITRVTSANALSSVFIIAIRNNNGGSSTLQLDGSGGAWNFSTDTIMWSGRNNTVAAFDNLAGNNTFSAPHVTWVGGGGTYPIQCDAGTLTISSTIPETAAAGARSLMFSGSGNIVMSGVIQDVVDMSNSVVKAGTGVVTLSAANTYSGLTTINNGVLLLDGSIAASGTTGVNVVGGQLGGIGTINAAVTVQPGGSLSPGDLGVGTLTINNNLTLAGNVTIAVNKSLSPAASNSVATVSGTITNIGNGSIIVTNLGPALAVGNSFKLFNQPVVNGGAMAVIGNGVAWNNHLALDGSVSVASLTIPQPIITSVSLTGTDLVLNGINGYTSGGYYVLSTTNLSLPRSSWARVSTNVFGGASFSVTNTVTPGTPLSFYTIQLQ
jgi:fibronectin-binding autotransporter adhesin